MIPRELLGPSDLTKAPILCIYKLTEVIMIIKHWNFVLAASQIVFPGFKSLNNCWKLTIVDLVASLSRNHFSKKIGYWILLSQIGLCQN